MAVDAHLAQPQVAREATDLVRVLKRQAQGRPGQTAFIYLRDGENEDSSITYAELDRRARAVAARLQEMGLAGKHVLLAYPPGLEFVAGLFGCFYAGCVAVPTSLAHRRRRLERFGAIVADAQAHVVLSTAEAARQFTETAGGDEWKSNGSARPAIADALADLIWIATEEIEDEWAARWEDVSLKPNALAMLQYTSGSTSEPKGVMLTHSNLIHNTRAIHSAFEVGGSEMAVFWLPTYHDMGLVGGVMAPVAAAITNITMSPTTFLQHPIKWLEAISRYRATISGGPNFAYDLCVRKVTDEQRAKLDLSSWTLAFVGAEPVQAHTLERFAETFAPCGFDANAFYPCYGLAESTLMVTGPNRCEGVRTIDDRSGATQHSPGGAPSSLSTQHSAPSTLPLVSCGRPVGGAHVKIVDPDKRTEVCCGEVGEIWITGPSVGLGYWNRPDQTQRCFGAHLADTRDGPYFRTGDLGFIEDGRLYVTGRRDDLIIVRGVNRYPQDLEATAAASHPLLAHHRGAAFAVNGADENHHVLVHEVTRSGAMGYDPVLDAAAQAILIEHDLALDAIVLVRGGTIPRTSSGKIQRNACRDAFLSGELHVVAERSLRMNGETSNRPSVQTSNSPNVRTSKDGAVSRSHRLTVSPTGAFDIVCEHVRALDRAMYSELTPETHVTALGLDSLQRVELVASLEETFSARLPNTCDVHTLGELAVMVQEHLIDHPQRAIPIEDIPDEYHEIARFPELIELNRHEEMLHKVVGDIPYFRADEGVVAKDSPCRDGISHIDGGDYVNFCGYDYLGMSRHPEVAAAVREAVARYGTSAGASRLVSGEKQVHRELEQALSSFLGTEDAIVFVSGHATNVTTIGHLFGSGDLIVHDVLAHNSILQGARLSGAASRAFPHNDWQALDAILSEMRGRYRRVLIAIEGVYSMDGDWPELPRFVELKKKHKALLLVDEAHSLGTMGATGRGIAEHYGVDRADVDMWMGTLSKSMASCGGFIAGSADLVKYLKYTAPGFVYSVGLSPPNAAAALASIRILDREPQRVSALRERSQLFLELARSRGLDTGLAAGTPVVPVIVGNSADSLRLSRALFNRGINVHPILRPAVPEDAARLRFFITINHSEQQIREAVDAVAEASKAVGRRQ